MFVAIAAGLWLVLSILGFTGLSSYARQPQIMGTALPKCAACGYDLRGLSTDARCPECGGKTRIRERPIGRDRERRNRLHVLVFLAVPMIAGGIVFLEASITANEIGVWSIMSGLIAAGAATVCALPIYYIHLAGAAMLGACIVTNILLPIGAMAYLWSPRVISSTSTADVAAFFLSLFIVFMTFALLGLGMIFGGVIGVAMGRGHERLPRE